MMCNMDCGEGLWLIAFGVMRKLCDCVLLGQRWLLKLLRVPRSDHAMHSVGELRLYKGRFSGVNERYSK